MKSFHYQYRISELAHRLLQIALFEKKNIILSTLASIIGNIAHMGLMGFGASAILYSAGKVESGSLLLWLGLTLLCALLIPIMRYFEGYLSHVAAYALLADLRVRLFQSLRKLAPACLIDREKGDIISIAIADIETIESFFAHTIGPMFTVILLPLITLCYAGLQHRIYVYVLLPIYIMISVIIPLLALKSGRNLGMRYRTQIGALKSVVLESVYGLKDIQIFGAGQKRMNRVKKESLAINQTAHYMTLHRQLVNALPAFFIYLSRILIVFVAYYLSANNPQDISGIIILSFVVSASFSSSQSLITVVSSLLETFAAAERFFELEDAEPAVTESLDAEKPDRIENIHFDHVDFTYATEADPILKDLDLTIKKGEKIGIIGPSGSGKSTILRLLLRFWDPNQGQILLDRQRLADVKLKDLRSRIALLEQSTFIYNNTVADNIALGKPHAPREEIVQAAKRAGIHKTIESLPEDYDTILGELGNQLSGGEKQRLGIARIMLLDPDVIVMDEPTSNLDVFNEKAILKTLRDEYGDKTLIIVSHRKSTLIDCERILRLHDKTLHELG